MKKMGVLLIIISFLIAVFYLIMVLPNIITPSNPEIQNSSIIGFTLGIIPAIIIGFIGILLFKKSKRKQ